MADTRNFRKETKPLGMSVHYRSFRGFLILSKMKKVQVVDARVVIHSDPEFEIILGVFVCSDELFEAHLKMMSDIQVDEPGCVCVKNCKAILELQSENEQS